MILVKRKREKKFVSTFVVEQAAFEKSLVRGAKTKAALPMLT